MAVFYRVVSQPEYEDILATGVLRAGPSSAEGKYFWSAVEEARLFREKVEMLGWESECIIVEIEIGAAAAERIRRFPDLDQIGLGCYAEIDDLRGATIREVRL